MKHSLGTVLILFGLSLISFVEGTSEIRRHHQTLASIFTVKNRGRKLSDLSWRGKVYENKRESECIHLCLMQYNTQGDCSSVNHNELCNECFANSRHVLDDPENITIVNNTTDWVWIDLGIGPPQAPKDVSVTWNGTVVSISWVAGFDSGFKQAFTVEYKKIADASFSLHKSNISDIGDGDKQTELLLGLDNGADYIMRVTSTNTRPVGINRAWVDYKLSTRLIEISVEGVGKTDFINSGSAVYNYLPVIKVGNSVAHSVAYRSYSVMVLNGTGEETDFRQFDLYGRPSDDQALHQWYQTIPDGSIVVIGTYDEPSSNALKTLEVLKDLTGRTFNIGFRAALAVIGYKGPNKPNWVASQYVPSGGGLAHVSATVPVQLHTP